MALDAKCVRTMPAISAISRIDPTESAITISASLGSNRLKGDLLVNITPKTMRINVPPAYTTSCTAARNSALRRKYKPATPISEEQTHGGADDVAREHDAD